jgi:hypothetical protein
MSRRTPQLWLCAALLIALAWIGPGAPRSALAQANADPLPPLNAWALDADGNLYVLDAAQVVWQRLGNPLQQSYASKPLAYGLSDSRGQIAADTERLYIRSDHWEGIKVLRRETLVELETIPIDAAALAVEPGKRLFVIERRPAPLLEGLWTFAVVTLPLDDLGAEPQEFGITASQPYGSLFDLLVDAPQNLLYVGFLDTGGSPNRHYRTYRAYDLESGKEVDMGLPHDPGSTALRPALTEDGGVAVSYRWEGVYPIQERIYLLDRGQTPATIENVSGPLAIDPTGRRLYVVRERGLWVLEQDGNAGFRLCGIQAFLQQPPEEVLLSSGAGLVYLVGNGWLTAFVEHWLQCGQRINSAVTPLPAYWTSAANPNAQTPRLFTAAEDGETAFLNLQPSNEWYIRSGEFWIPMGGLQYPQNLGLDRLSLSPSMAEDGVALARGGWQDGRRTIRRAEYVQAAGTEWPEWTPPIAYVAGQEGARTLYVLEPGAAARPVPVGGSSENPAWSPGWTHLVFQNNMAGDWEIYRVPAGCRGATEGPSSAAQECAVERLTDSAGDDLLPAWSPDGRRIAFVSLRDGNPEIYVMLADGSQPTRLTFAPGGDWRPAWLPDSRHLVFTSDREGSNDIYLMEVPRLLGGVNLREPLVTAVVTGPADERDPAVSGDNELLYLSDVDGVMQPYVADLTSFLDGSSLTPLTGSPVLHEVTEPVGHPGWLPDGRLLFTSGGAIYTAPRDAGAEAWNEVAAPEAAALHPAGGPTWYWPQPTLGPVRLP